MNIYLPWYAKLMFLVLYAGMGFVINYDHYDTAFWLCLGMGLVGAFVITVFLPRWVEGKLAEWETLLK